MAEKTQVLICGGSAVGMSTALFLSHLGVSCVVVEKKAGPSGHPGFRGLSARTMELYRSVGVEGDIHAAAGEQHRFGSVARLRNLSAPDVSWFDLLPWADEYRHLSPCVYTTCDQDLLEPVLRDNALTRGADIRYATELVEWAEDDDGVRALVRDATGAETTIRAAYLVAADGVHSPLREGSRIGLTGPGTLEHRVNVMFTTDLDVHLQGRRLTACLVSDINGSLVPRQTRPWVMSVPFDPEQTRLEHAPAEYWLDLLRAGVGHQDFRAEIVDVLPWRAAAQVAERFRHGRLFLVGDAAHAMPPTGGFGGNSGIQDAFNLAWKLAAVTGGGADPALLDSYEAERRPVAEFTVEQALLRLRSWFRTADGPPPQEPVDDNIVMFGYRYQSDTAVFEDPREPLALPGCRAPNLRIGPTAAPRSIVDLFGRGFVLLCGPNADAWHAAAEPMGDELSCYRIGSSDDLSDVDNAWTDTYRLTDAGAVLVRPDGFVAWRAREAPDSAEPGAAAGALGGALRRLRLGAGQIVPA